MSCACTAVMRSRFSVSARWAFSCASCACRCAYCRVLLVDVVLTDATDEGRDSDDDGCFDIVAVMFLSIFEVSAGGVFVD